MKSNRLPATQKGKSWCVETAYNYIGDVIPVGSGSWYLGQSEEKDCGSINFTVPKLTQKEKLQHIIKFPDMQMPFYSSGGVKL